MKSVIAIGIVAIAFLTMSGCASTGYYLLEKQDLVFETNNVARMNACNAVVDGASLKDDEARKQYNELCSGYVLANGRKGDASYNEQVAEKFVQTVMVPAANKEYHREYVNNKFDRVLLKEGKICMASANFGEFLKDNQGTLDYASHYMNTGKYQDQFDQIVIKYGSECNRTINSTIGADSFWKYANAHNEVSSVMQAMKPELTAALRKHDAKVDKAIDDQNEQVVRNVRAKMAQKTGKAKRDAAFYWCKEDIEVVGWRVRFEEAYIAMDNIPTRANRDNFREAKADYQYAVNQCTMMIADLKYFK